MTLPNLITSARIVLIPIFVVVYLLPTSWSYLAAAILFALAAFTDWLDGYLARRLQQTSPFGAFLDPVADKLIVVSALILLIAHHYNVWLTLPGLIIVGREIVISALREWMAEMNHSVRIAVNILGKVKTALQMTAIAVLMANPPDLGSAWVSCWVCVALCGGVHDPVVYGRVPDGSVANPSRGSKRRPLKKQSSLTTKPYAECCDHNTHDQADKCLPRVHEDQCPGFANGTFAE